MNSDISNFKCLKCGACCRQNGYVRLRREEPDQIAYLLGLDVYEFIETYTCLTKDRQTLSLLDKENGECIFLTPDGCRINAAKPTQCRDFPEKWRFKSFDSVCVWAKKQSDLPDR